MPELRLHGKKLTSVFELLGEHENDITYSLGWALAHSPAFLRAIVRDLFPKTSSRSVETILLQEHDPKRGVTDIELLGPDVHCILEAKRGWVLPDIGQLRKYAPRIEKASKRHALVVLSECDADYAGRHMPAQVGGVQVLNRSWRQVRDLAVRSASRAGIKERALLHELTEYLGSLMNMQDQESNLVFVVSLGKGIPKWSTISWRDIVVKKRRYFHPHGGRGWPTVPPNYLAFRYDGKLQSIHHVEGYDIVTEMHSHIPEIEADEWEQPYILYRLGQPMSPSREVKTGKIYPSGRVWAAIDLLLTCRTISAARDRTNKRLNDAR